MYFLLQIETGAIAKMQQFSTWSASIAVVGHVINAYKFYSFSSADSDPWCLVEAITSCFGELALVLWQVCAACTVFLTMRPEWIKKREKRQWIYLIFHFMVWTPSLLTTAIPLSYGILGGNSYDGGSSGNYWCWFVPGNSLWEQGQV